MKEKVIDSGVSIRHAEDWTVGMAMRELIQNYLDVRNEYQVGGSISYKDGMAVIKDNGPGMQVKHLSFGMNDKSIESIGQFGEGLKSAFLTLARNEIYVEIRTNGLEICPTIHRSENFETETMHYYITEMEARHAARLKGTMVKVECTQEELNEGKSYFVELISKSKGDFQWMDKGNISLPGGVVYIKGSAIGEIENARFSYHLSGEKAAEAINRDRSSLNMKMIEPMIARLVGNTSSTKVMEEFLQDVMGSQSYWENRLVAHRGEFYQKTQVWMRVWNRLFGKRPVLSGRSDREAQYRGYEILSHINWDTNAFLANIGVRSSHEVVNVRKSKPKFGKVGVRSLNLVERDNLNYARRMTKKHYGDPGTIIVCTNPGALMGEQYSSYNGIYDPKFDKTYINRSALQNVKTALHTILHETVHKVTGTDDCTSQFEQALLDVAVGMIIARKRK